MQVVREPKCISEMRAYIALLACTMKVLKSVEQNPDRDVGGPLGDEKFEEGRQEEGSGPWGKLPGSASWDFATGSEGNTVNKNLIHHLGARTLLRLKELGAIIVRTPPPE
jgi:hypothetical protein